MLARLILPQSVWEKICQQAVAEWPRECLGMLVGTPDGRVQDAYPIANASTDPHRFLSEPVSLLAAEKRRRREGWHLLGFYHSHPDGQPVPSAIDTDPNVNFWLDGTVVSLIIAVRRLGPAIPCSVTPANTARPSPQTAELLASQRTASNQSVERHVPLNPSGAQHATSTSIQDVCKNYYLEARAYRLLPQHWVTISVCLDRNAYEGTTSR